MQHEVDVAIIGAGIVGLAVALEMLERFPATSLILFEKESTVAVHQTGHNSGVIHSGIYYKPGSLKARLCVQGAADLMQFCNEHGVSYKQCGKIIVATSEDELPKLEELLRRGQGNGLHGLRLLNEDEIREIEPHSAGIGGIHVPSTSIVDFRRVAEKYAELVMQRGGSIHLSQEVVGLKRSGTATTVVTPSESIRARLVINCAGLQSDRVKRMEQRTRDMAIIPFRGEYYEICPEKQYLVRGLIYPVPDPQFPFLGVHFTTRIGGGVEAGPNAVLALKREGYSKSSFNLKDIAEYFSFPGFWHMAGKHWEMSMGEYHRSWSKTAFVRALQRLIPEISENDLIPGGSGVRAQAVGLDGKLMDDFVIGFSEKMVNVCNVPSPAATASLAIARYIVDRICSEMPANVLRSNPVAQST